MRLRRSSSQVRSFFRLTPKRAVTLAAVLLAVLAIWVNLRIIIIRSTQEGPFFPPLLSIHKNTETTTKSSTDAGGDGSIQDLPKAIASRGHVTSPSGGAAACLLVMDDNHLLIEWLAYHYHTLPLRYLVIAVDPRSKTRPDNVLQRWTTTTTTTGTSTSTNTDTNGVTATATSNSHNLTIVQWNHDDDYMTPDELTQAEAHVRRYFGRTKLTPELIRHRARQRMFYYKCMQHCKQQGRHWTALIDTDEYMALSYDTLHRYGRTRVPSVDQPGSILQFLNQELVRRNQHKDDAFPNITKPCVQIPRIRFGAKESEQFQVESNVPSGFDGFSFQTLRWRKHASEGNYNLNRISKTLLDLSRVSWEELQPIDSIHRPIKSLCGHRKLHIRKSEQALVIHHYLGTYQQYSFRDDARQGNERSEKARSQ